MAIYKIQGKAEKRNGIYYEFDSEDTPLGEGGMGKVFKGRCVDEKSMNSRDVAIKFMFSDLPPYAIEKARREAAIHLRHDNLIEMLGFIETESKSVLGEKEYHYHVVSELLEGVTLDHLFQGKLVDQEGNFVPFAEKLFKDYQNDVNLFSITIIKNILSGLMTMHDANYIHRDIDPTNIMITSDGHIKLIDFGIAKKINSLTTNDKHLTQAGQFVGKPEYAAPELILGAINEQNQTTDIYAVGILLFQCITGHIPFQGNRTDIIQKQLNSSMPLNQIKHRGLRKIIDKATRKSQSERYQSAAEFRVDLEKLDLNDSGKNGVWKPLYSYILGATAACAVIFVALWNWFGFPKDNADSSTERIEFAFDRSLSYPAAIKSLHNSDLSSEAIKQLVSLSESGDADATYLLSRLYFKSKIPGDFIPDSISELQNSLKLGVDNEKAHELLIKAVNQNPKNYHALFDLACDYWKADQRTEAVSERDGDKAESYYSQALTYAKEADDQEYVGMINEYLDKIKLWRNIIKEMNSK